MSTCFLKDWTQKNMLKFTGIYWNKCCMDVTDKRFQVLHFCFRHRQFGRYLTQRTQIIGGHGGKLQTLTQMEMCTWCLNSWIWQREYSDHTSTGSHTWMTSCLMAGLYTDSTWKWNKIKLTNLPLPSYITLVLLWGKLGECMQRLCKMISHYLPATTTPARAAQRRSFLRRLYYTHFLMFLELKNLFFGPNALYWTWRLITVVCWKTHSRTYIRGYQLQNPWGPLHPFARLHRFLPTLVHHPRKKI